MSPEVVTAFDTVVKSLNPSDFWILISLGVWCAVYPRAVGIYVVVWLLLGRFA